MNKKQILAFVITLMVLMTSFNFGTTESKAANADYKQLSISNLYTDRLDTCDDVNYYKFDIQTGYFTVDFMLGGAYRNDAIRNGWKLSIYDAEGMIDSYFLNDNITTKKYAYPAGTYYAVVKAVTQSDTYAPVGLDYKIRVNNTSSNDWEREYNNESNFANTIATNKTIKGNLIKSDGRDYFKFQIKNKKNIKIQFSQLQKNTSDRVKNGWNVTLYDSGFKKMQDMTVTTNGSTPVLTLNAGLYYVVVKAATQSDTYAPVGLDYKICICSSDIPKSTSITAAKGQKKAVKISWKAVKNVDGYKIYRSTKKNGTYKKIATVKGGKKNTYKNTKLKSGKMYYYKIKTYKKQNSITSESSFSKIKSARAK